MGRCPTPKATCTGCRKGEGNEQRCLQLELIYNDEEVYRAGPDQVMKVLIAGLSVLEKNAQHG